MSQVRMKILLGLLLALAVLSFVTACGTSTEREVGGETSVEISESGHEPGWLPLDHSLAAQSSLSVCEECHGTDLTGGITGVSCTQCHLGSATDVHPLVWSQATGTIHAPYVAANGSTACSNQYCHGADLSGVADSGPSCSSCHLGGPTSVHPTDWGTSILTKHGLYVVANGSISCRNMFCHGGNLQGVAGSGPSCTSCHSLP